MTQGPKAYAAFDDGAYLHIYVLSCLAIAQPIFDLLGKYPEFFVAHQSDNVDVLLLTFFLVFILPLPLVFLLAALKKISGHAFTWGFAFLLMAMGGLLFLPLVKQSGFPDLIVALISICAGAMIAMLCFAWPVIRQFLSALGIALVISPIYFLLFTPVYSSVISQETKIETDFKTPSDVPVVIIIFDEFPLSAIMNEKLAVDRRNFPNFARLADLSYWFRNGTPIAASTVLSVPAIMTGNIPKEFKRPTSKAYPENIFTLLSNTHRMNVQEGSTRLCPRKLCKESQWVLPRDARMEELVADLLIVYGHLVLPNGLVERLPSISSSWKEFFPFDDGESNGIKKSLSRVMLYDRFLSNIRPGVPEGLHLIHLTFPHIPYEYLPSGKRYSGGDVMPGRNRKHDRWESDTLFINQAYQRLLLQTGTTDRMIGSLLDRLEDNDLLDSALIVVTADHGAAFIPDRSRRGDLRNKILESSIMPVPFFVKVPGQTVGVVDDRNVETIDILPTVAELVGVQRGPEMDGQNLFDENIVERPFKTFYRGYSSFWRYETDAHLDDKNRIVAWKYNNFYDQTRANLTLYAVGPQPQLLKRDVADLGAIMVSEYRYTLDDSIDLRIDMDGDFIPAHIFGEIQTDNLEHTIPLAFAINGIVEATSHSYFENGEHRFSAMVPETAFEDGENALEILSIAEDNGKLQIEQLSNMSVQLDGYELVTSPSGPKELLIRDLDGLIAKKSDNYEVKVRKSMEDRYTVEFHTEISIKEEQSLKLEILVFEADRCVYKNVVVLSESGKFNRSIVLPKSKFDNFGHLPIRLFALDSLRRSRELVYYTEYPYLD